MPPEQEKNSAYETSKVVILPVPYEKTTTYIKGTKNGPTAIIDASRNMEIYDEELDKNISDGGICTLESLEIDDKPEIMMNILFEKLKNLINDNKFIVVIGESIL